MRDINEIIIHTTATRAGWMGGYPTGAKVAEVRRWHVEDNKWSDIGYHFLIDRDGTVAEGRPVERIGAHVKGRNDDTIGIALFGGHGSAETDSFDEHYTDDQDIALRILIAELQRKYGPGLKLSGHNEYAAKACPGFNVMKWFTDKEPVIVTPQDQDAATEATRYRWRLAEIRDKAIAALNEK